MVTIKNRLFSSIAWLYHIILKSGGGIGAVAAFLMVAMVIFSIVSRTWFNYGATYANQFVIWCSAFICFIGASYTQSLRRNITITIITGRLPKRAQRWLLAFTTALSFIVCMVFLYYSSSMLQDDIITGVRSPAPFRPYMAPIHAVQTVGLSLLALVLITQTIQTFRELFSHKPTEIEAQDIRAEEEL